ncbi:S1 RNA-binding domain-containing protein [Streptomyces sp. NPDC051636]|uniref:S1 RNA-binding domain-containing protein n=1 Tax=Streptomyces sp. NPDC051636 TaxID=3365663 RepID=UPI0037BD26BB
MTEPPPTPFDQLRTRLEAVRRGEARTGTVAGFDGRDVVVRLDGDGPQAPAGRIPRHELSWAHMEDPSEAVAPGQRITAEVMGPDDGKGRVWLSAKACEDEPLRRFLLGIEPGDVLTGTVSAVRNFGVFVHLDGEPVHPLWPGTGFIRVPELTWSRIDHPENVAGPGQPVTGEVLAADLCRDRWPSVPQGPAGRPLAPSDRARG